jgi:F-type H+-transporting ATPase subunit b
VEIVLANFFETEPVEVQQAVTEEKTSNPILPTANEVFWGGLTFVLLWALMKWVLLPPITRSMNARAAKVRGDLEAADSTSARADAELHEYEASLQSAKAEAVRIIEDARTSADGERREVISVAEADAASVRADAAREVVEAKDRAKADLQQSVASVAIQAAEAVVQKPLDRGAAMETIEDYVNRAGSQN